MNACIKHKQKTTSLGTLGTLAALGGRAAGGGAPFAGPARAAYDRVFFPRGKQIGQKVNSPGGGVVTIQNFVKCPDNAAKYKKNENI